MSRASSLSREEVWPPRQGGTMKLLLEGRGDPWSVGATWREGNGTLFHFLRKAAGRYVMLCTFDMSYYRVKTWALRARWICTTMRLSPDKGFLDQDHEPGSASC